MTADALRTYEELMATPDSLLQLHPSVATGSVGKPAGDPRPILISVFILQHTAFENFIELTVRAYAEERFRLSTKVSELPDYYAQHVVNERIQQDPKKAHQFLGERFFAFAELRAEERIAKFNTPNFVKTNSLFKDLAGFDNVVGRSTWQNMNAQSVEEKLDSFVFRRGELVHTGRSVQDIYLRDIKNNRTFLDNLTRAVALTAAKDWEDVCAKYGWSNTYPGGAPK